MVDGIREDLPVGPPDDTPPAGPRAAPVEQIIRVVCVHTCGPSPANQCLYREGLTYNAPDADAAWLLEQGYAYREGDPPPLPIAEQRRRARETAFATEQAESLAALEAARLAREEADAADEHAAEAAAEEARLALLAARAVKGALPPDDPEISADDLRLVREAAAAALAEMQAEEAAEAEEARQRLLAARRERANG